MTMTTLGLRDQACLLCGSTSYEPIKRFDAGVVVGECARCGLMFTPVRAAEPEKLSDVSVEQVRWLYGPIVEGRVPHFRENSFADYLARIGRVAPGRRLLDVGCAHGFFSAAARRAGYEVTAVEPNAAMAAFAREVLGLRALHGRLDQVDLGSERWHVATFTDSLEYFPDPVTDLSRVARHLAPGGVLFAKVPNGSYFRLRHEIATRLKRRLGVEEFSPLQRVAHYTIETLSRLVERAGFEVVETGAPLPIHSPSWLPLTGYWLESAEPWFVGAPQKLARHVLNNAGRIEARLAGGKNHLSPSIYVLARRKAGADEHAD
jgi:SAM-dependent methyltransferase